MEQAPEKSVGGPLSIRKNVPPASTDSAPARRFFLYLYRRPCGLLERRDEPLY